MTLCSPDPQASRPPDEKVNVLQVRLPTNFKAARFESDTHTALLRRLEADIEATSAARVVCLGDSFDDTAVAAGLDDTETGWITRLMAGRDWVWIEGNHDPGPADLGGSHRADYRHGPLTFRHIAEPGTTGEVSGHYHPKVRLAGQSRPCLLVDAARVVLPAYGTYTGGLRTDAAALAALMGAEALAVMVGPVPRPLPMPR